MDIKNFLKKKWIVLKGIAKIYAVKMWALILKLKDKLIVLGKEFLAKAYDKLLRAEVKALSKIDDVITKWLENLLMKIGFDVDDDDVVPDFPIDVIVDEVIE